MKNEEATTFATSNGLKAGQKQDSGHKDWQSVTIGGVTGILMGAGSMFAVQATADSNVSEAAEADNTLDTNAGETGGIRVATVDQNLSFGEAFAAARSEVGAGGVFHWHGNVYNTYTAEEWNSMSDAEHRQFAQQVLPEVTTEVQHHAAHHTDASHTAAHQSATVEEETASQQATTVSHEADSDEPEVHFLGVRQVDTADGGTWNVGHITIDDQDVALIDLDNDEVFDVTVSDRNHNNQIDDNEVVDISNLQLTVTDFAIASAQEDFSVQGEAELVSNPQDDLAADMPDYMNDADIQTL